MTDVSPDKLIENFNYKLGDDLKNLILKDWFIPIYCNTFLDWLEKNYKLDMSEKMYTKELDNLITELLSVEKCKEYLFSKNEFIKMMYHKHYIDNDKSFKLMSLRQSFVASILMHMWH